MQDSDKEKLLKLVLTGQTKEFTEYMIFNHWNKVRSRMHKFSEENYSAFRQAVFFTMADLDIEKFMIDEAMQVFDDAMLDLVDD